MSDTSTILQCTDVHKSFVTDKRTGNSLTVLRGVNLEIARGDFIVIVGASGSGKSTLLHILGGLDKPTSGTVHWQKHNIFSLDDESLSRERMKSVGFVFQFHHLLPEFSAVENVMIPSMIAGNSSLKAETRAKELLQKVGLSERFHHSPAELSGGEQQRVAVARALVNSPAIILADEPSGNLDSVNGEQLHELLTDLNKTEGQTFVIVTHNQHLTAKSNKIYTMADGLLHQQGYQS